MRVEAPLVSVVVPTRDRSALLLTTLASALWQEGVRLEVVVVDDGSTDGTAARVADLADDRVSVFRREEPHGVASARNHGVERSAGTWVAFLDDDDVWAPRKLASQLRSLEAARATWGYAGAVKIDDRNQPIGGSRPPPPDAVAARLRSWNLVPGGCSGVLVERSALESVGGFDPDLVNLADWDLWIRLAETGPPACAPDPLVGYRLHRGQSSTDVDLILREAAALRATGRAAPDLGALHHYLGHKALIAGRRRTAVREFGRAALHGEVAPVAASLWSIARPRLGIRTRPDDADEDAAWREPAGAWLRRLPDPAITAGARPLR
jgi:glycosyltransferase involved in cell wall biosynthesis